jgi:NADH-quinone oxidoreductase subunit N
MYMKDPSEAVQQSEPLSAGFSAALILPAAGTLMLGIFPSWVLDFAGRSSNFLR